jgi:hypothetical protein
MGLLDAFKKKKTEIVWDNKGNAVGTIKTDTDISKYLGIFDSKVSCRNYITLFSEIAELQFPIRAIIERALKAEFTLKYYDSDETEWHNDAIKKFLSQPNEIDTFHEFLSKIIAYYLVTGNAYIYSNSPSLVSSKIERWNRTDDYYVLPTDKTEIVYQDRQKLFQGAALSDIIKNYTLSTGTSRIEFSPENVLNIRDLKLSFDNRTLEGGSRIDSLKYPVSNIIAAYEARNAIFVKRGALGMIVSRKTDAEGSVPMRKSEKDQINRELHRHGFTGDKDLVPISDIPVDFVNFGVSIRDLEAFRETFEDAKTIAAAYNIPAILVPGNQSTAYDRAITTAEKAVYQNMVIPLTNRIMESLNSWLGLINNRNKNDMYLYADFSKIECLQEDKKFNAEVGRINSETAIKQYKEGFITYNQALIDMGKEAIPGGDYLVYEDKNRNKNQIQNQNDTQGKF